MVGERQSGLERDSRFEEGDASDKHAATESIRSLYQNPSRTNEPNSRNLVLLRLLQSPMAIRRLLPIHRKTLPTPARLRCIGSTFAARE